MFKHFIIIFLGGGLGSCLRYAISSWLNPMSVLLPWGTLLANVLACFVLGASAYWVQSKFINHELWRLFIMVGVCGGFSTFSTFSSELWSFWQNENWINLFFYLIISILCCHLSLILGMYIAKSIYTV
jgi:CrcB protein